MRELEDVRIAKKETVDDKFSTPTLLYLASGSGSRELLEKCIEVRKIIGPLSDKLRGTQLIFAKDMWCKINIKNADDPITTRLTLHKKVTMRKASFDFNEKVIIVLP